jgi:electron transfer flavoprotein alpha/beta subunit
MVRALNIEEPLYVCILNTINTFSNHSMQAEVKARSDLLKSSEPSPRNSAVTETAPSQTKRADPDDTRPSTCQRGGANKEASCKILEKLREEESKEDLPASSEMLVQVVLPEIPKKAGACNRIPLHLY